MADLEPHVPQAIEDGLGDGLAPGGLLVGKQKQQIDVGAGRQHAAAIAAGGDDRHVLGFRGILRRIEMLRRELVEHADDLVLHEAQPLGAAPSVPVLDQQFLGCGASLHQRGLDAAGHLQSQFARVAGVHLGQALEVGRNFVRVEDFGFARDLIAECQHATIEIAERRRCVTGGGIAGGTRTCSAQTGENRRYLLYFIGVATNIFSLTPLPALSKNKHSADLSTAACGRLTNPAKARAPPSPG